MMLAQGCSRSTGIHVENGVMSYEAGRLGTTGFKVFLYSYTWGWDTFIRKAGVLKKKNGMDEASHRKARR